MLQKSEIKCYHALPSSSFHDSMYKSMLSYVVSDYRDNTKQGNYL